MLLTGLADRKRLHDLGAGTLPQAAMAELLASGGHDPHVRAARQLNRKRRDALSGALAEHFPDWRPVGVAAGPRLVVRFPDDADDVDDVDEVDHADDREVSDLFARRRITVLLPSGSCHRGRSAALSGPRPGLAPFGPDRPGAAIAEMMRIVGGRRHHG